MPLPLMQHVLLPSIPHGPGAVGTYLTQRSCPTPRCPRQSWVLSGTNTLQLPSLCQPPRSAALCSKTGNAAAEPRFLSLLTARLRGAGARLAVGLGLAWDPMSPASL